VRRSYLVPTILFAGGSPYYRISSRWNRADCCWARSLALSLDCVQVANRRKHEGLRRGLVDEMLHRRGRLYSPDGFRGQIEVYV